jgi:hypothetical protein
MKEKYRKNALTTPGFFAIGFFLLGPFVHELSHLVLIHPSGCEYMFKPDFNVFTGFRGSYDLSCTAQPLTLGLFYFSGYTGTFVASVATLYSSSKNIWNKDLLSALGVGMLLSIVSSISLKGDVFNGLKAFGLQAYSDSIEISLISLILVLTVLEVERHHLLD